MNNREYKDILGNKIYPKFGISGFNDDITICDLFIKKPLPKFINWIKKDILIKVYQGLTTASLEEVSKWTNQNYFDLVLKCINEYNTKVLARKIVKEKINKLNI